MTEKRRGELDYLNRPKELHPCPSCLIVGATLFTTLGIYFLHLSLHQVELFQTLRSNTAMKCAGAGTYDRKRRIGWMGANHCIAASLMFGGNRALDVLRDSRERKLRRIEMQQKRLAERRQAFLEA